MQVIFSFHLAARGEDLRRHRYFQQRSGSNFTRKKALFKEQGMMKDKPEDRE